MKDALLIFLCFILIFLFGFSIASWSLLPITKQDALLNETNGSLSNVTVAGESGRLWNQQLLRDIINWGIWKVFGQVAEPYNNAVSGTDKVIPIVALRK
jgi:hypothetical protein